MIAVVSQCWTKDEGLHLDAYEHVYREFLEFHRQHRGFRGRQLLRGIADPCHLTNLRFFDEVAAYEEMIALPGYATHIERLTEHIDTTRVPPKEYAELIVNDGPAGFTPLR